MMRKTVMVAAVVLSALGAVQAADAPKGDAPKSTEKGRDWTQVDTNKDGYIQPEEMEKWLQANPASGKK